MRKKLAVVAVVTALAGLPLAAVPAQAAETHICDIFAEPFDVPCRIVTSVVCQPPMPPLSICR